MTPFLGALFGLGPVKVLYPQNHQYIIARIWKGTYTTTAQFMSAGAGIGVSGLVHHQLRGGQQKFTAITYKLTSGMMKKFHATASHRMLLLQRPRLYGPGA